MQSNRLVVTLNKEMQIGFERGLNQVYQNSNLVNEFIVKPSFELEPKQTLWVTFENTEGNSAVPLKPSLLAERTVTATDDEQQAVDNDVAQMQQTESTEQEFYTILPKDVMSVPGKCNFSLQVCQSLDGTSDSVDEIVQQMPIKTSDIAGFTVYGSLAGMGPDGSDPTDLDILALYNQAIDAKVDAEQSAREAQEAAQNAIATNYAPYVNKENGNWYEYSKEERGFVDTGVHAQGPAGEMQDLSDYATKQFVDDSIAAAVTTALNTPV